MFAISEIQFIELSLKIVFMGQTWFRIELYNTCYWMTDMHLKFACLTWPIQIPIVKKRIQGYVVLNRQILIIKCQDL